MTDAQTEPMQDASTHGRKASSWSDPHQAPPEFHCPVCDGTGSLMPHDEWKPEVCWSCNDRV